MFRYGLRHLGTLLLFPLSASSAQNTGANIMARTATNRPPVAVESVRADDVRLTDQVWFQNWTGEFVGGSVVNVAWEGEDVSVSFSATFGQMSNPDFTFTTSPSNRVFVAMR